MKPAKRETWTTTVTDKNGNKITDTWREVHTSKAVEKHNPNNDKKK